MWANVELRHINRNPGTEIQRTKVLRHAHAGSEPTAELPPHFDQIKFSAGGGDTGERNLHDRKPQQRSRSKNQEENQTWKQAKRKIFRKKAIDPKIKILL